MTTPSSEASDVFDFEFIQKNSTFVLGEHFRHESILTFAIY